jgi:hypothetical protein
MMKPGAARIGGNPVLRELLLTSTVQAALIALQILPMLPTQLRGFTLGKMGREHLKPRDVKRAPGAQTRRVDIKWGGQTYTVDQYAVDVPIPREMIQEADTAARMNVGINIDVSSTAMLTARGILDLSLEIEVAALVTDPTNYAGDNRLGLSGGAKWSAATGTPVTDVLAAREVVRKKTGRYPNRLLLTPDSLIAVSANPQVKSYLPSTQMGVATIEQLQTILKVPSIVVGEAISVNADETTSDVWGNNAVLAVVPTIGGAAIDLGQPALGFVSSLPDHPMAEEPWYDKGAKSWIYGATYERKPEVVDGNAGFLFSNVR